MLPLVVIATQRVSWKSKPIYKEPGTSGLDDSMGSFSITHLKGGSKNAANVWYNLEDFLNLTVHDSFRSLNSADLNLIDDMIPE